MHSDRERYFVKMPKYTQDDCRKLMDDLTKVRNVMVMGSMGHGKSVTMDNFGAKEGEAFICATNFIVTSIKGVIELMC